jgi:cytochrome P450
MSDSPVSPGGHQRGLQTPPQNIYQIPRYSSPEGITIAGYVIPAGWAVGSALSMNSSKDIFGEDANEFNPERWLGDDRRARYMDSLLATVLPFGFLTIVWDGSSYVYWQEHFAGGNE